MTGTIDNLRGLGGEQPLKRVGMFTVVGLTTDPTEVIVDDGTSLTTLPCLDGYRHRSLGDKVVAAQLAGNDWVVLGKISADQSPVWDVTQGTGDPSGGIWRETAGVWVADHLDGTRSLYLDMTGAAPAPVTVTATDAATWDGSSPSREFVDADGSRLAVWYYTGDAIYDACFGKTVTAMFLRITRTEDGTDRPLPLRLGMHNHAWSGVVIPVNQWVPGVLLAPGQTVLVPIPAAYLSVLADGTLTGFLAYAEVTDAPMRLEPAADLQIYFG